MARTDKLGQDVVPEHGTDTMAAILGCLVEVVSSTATSCAIAWHTRREKPDLILQPRQQWPRLAQGRESTFGGADPVSMPRMKQGAIVMGPSTAAWIKAARLMNPDMAPWKDWFANDLNQIP